MVSIIELSIIVNESLSTVEIDEIYQQSADAYGLDQEDIIVEVMYQTTGSIDIDIIGDVSVDQLEEFLEEELATLLEVHKSSVEVDIDENGTATYTITSGNAEVAEEANTILSDVNSRTILENEINEVFGISISSVEVGNDILAEVVVTIDSSEAENNLVNAAQTLEDLFEDQGYSTVAESNQKGLQWSGFSFV